MGFLVGKLGFQDLEVGCKAVELVAGDGLLMREVLVGGGEGGEFLVFLLVYLF